MTYPPRDDRLRHLIAQEINPHVASWKLAFFIADGIVTSRAVRGELKRIAEAHAAGEHCGDRNCDHCWTASVAAEDPAAAPSAPADRAACPDPIECGHEAALGQAQQEIRRLGLMVDEYAAGARGLSEKLREERTRAEAMTRAMESTAADALAHRGCHRDLMGQCLRAERAEAAVERVRSVLESEAVVGRSALDYRGLITSALMADEAQQPTPCSQPNPCEDGELCGVHEVEQAHADGEHEYCGVTCEVEFPSDKLRNTILYRAIPGSAGMLDELLRRAAAGQEPQS